jgi:hypothetical protein
LVTLLVANVVVDLLARYVLDDSLRAYAIERFSRLAAITVLAGVFPLAFANGWWPHVSVFDVKAYVAALCLVSGLILNVSIGATLIRKATEPLTAQITSDEGLKDGGLYIGILERLLVMCSYSSTSRQA